MDETKPYLKNRWLSTLIYTFAFLTTVALLCGLYATYKTHSVLKGSGYLEKWQEGVDGTAQTDLAYGDAPWEKLDIYYPTNQRLEPTRGVILFIHGGAWAFGDRADMTGFARRCAKAGYIAGTMGYRLYEESSKEDYSIDVILNEVDAALAKFKESVNEKGYKVDRAALAGDSAGGHILSLYAYSRGKNAPLQIAFIAPRVAPIDFRADAWEGVQKPETVAQVVSLMTGAKVSGEDVVNPTGDALKAVDSISPLSFLTRENVIPTLAAYGGLDAIVGTRHGRKLVEAFRSFDAKSILDVPEDDEETVLFDYLEYPKSGHMLASDSVRANEHRELFGKYLKRFFKPETAQEDAEGEKSAEENNSTQEDNNSANNLTREEQEPNDENVE